MKIDIRLKETRSPKVGDVLVTVCDSRMNWILISTLMENGAYVGVYLTGEKEVSDKCFKYIEELVDYYTCDVDEYELINGNELVLTRRQ